MKQSLAFCDSKMQEAQPPAWFFHKACPLKKKGVAEEVNVGTKSFENCRS